MFFVPLQKSQKIRRFHFAPAIKYAVLALSSFRKIIKTRASEVSWWVQLKTGQKNVGLRIFVLKLWNSTKMHGRSMTAMTTPWYQELWQSQLPNKALQGTSGQRGFPEFSLAAKDSGKSKFSVANLRWPLSLNVIFRYINIVLNYA